MQRALIDAKDILAEKEMQLMELNKKLEQLEQLHEPNERHKSDELAEKQTNGTVQHIADNDRETLLEKIRLLENQAIDLEISFSNEKAALIQQKEEAEKKYCESNEKLRHKLESEKTLLNNMLLDKEREINKLNTDMDEMRDNIRVYEALIDLSLACMYLTRYLFSISRKCIDRIKHV